MRLEFNEYSGGQHRKIEGRKDVIIPSASDTPSSSFRTFPSILDSGKKDDGRIGPMSEYSKEYGSKPSQKAESGSEYPISFEIPEREYSSS